MDVERSYVERGSARSTSGASTAATRPAWIVLAADNEDGLVDAAPHVTNPRVQSIFFNEAPTLDRPGR